MPVNILYSKNYVWECPIIPRITLRNIATVNEKIFAGLNFHGFNPTEVFAEILSCFLSQKCLLLNSSTYIHGNTSAVLLITVKTVKV